MVVIFRFLIKLFGIGYFGWVIFNIIKLFIWYNIIINLLVNGNIVIDVIFVLIFLVLLLMLLFSFDWL